MRSAGALVLGLVVAMVLATVGLVPACATGGKHALDLTGDDGGAGDDGGGVPPPAALGVALFGDACEAGAPPDVAWSPVRRISRVEYDNMVRDLLSDTTQPATGFQPESPMSTGVNFQTNTYAGVSALIAQQYQQAAETLAQTAVSSASTLSAIVPCQTQDAACAQQFIATFANRAFRGQLDDTESAALLSLYTTVATKFDFPTGIQAVITAVLESPRFLYVLEFGDGQPSGNVVALSQYEIAGRLALFLWRSVPDAALMNAAAMGNLASAAQVQAQATQMLADPKAKDAIDDFTTQWVELQSTASQGKDTQFAQWTSRPAIGEELMDETLTNVSQLALSPTGDLTTLLTSPSSYVNKDLATFYANQPPNGGAALGTGPAVTVADTALTGTANQYVSTSIPERAGILTNGSILSTQAHTTLPSSVLRGKLVREDILCDVLQPPPPSVPPAPTSVPEGGTTRSVFAAHETIPGCVTCHQYMDPIGFGFGNFDATGAYQTTDANGLVGTFPPIDATGQVNAMNAGELSASFNGAVDLVTQLAASTQVHECFTLQEFRYALSRIESVNDACSAQQIYQSFSSSSLNIQTLLVAIVASDAFRYRSVETAGSSCQ
jgi:hypothetical protein